MKTVMFAVMSGVTKTYPCCEACLKAEGKSLPAVLIKYEMNLSPFSVISHESLFK